MKERSKLKESNIFITGDFSQRVRAIRKALTPHLKAARNQGKRATMIYDHLLIEGKKFVLDKDNELKELSHAQDTGRPSTSVHTTPSRSSSVCMLIGDNTDRSREIDVRVEMETNMNVGDTGTERQVCGDSAELTDKTFRFEHSSFLHWNVNGLLTKLKDRVLIQYIFSFHFVCLVEMFVDCLEPVNLVSMSCSVL